MARRRLEAAFAHLAYSVARRRLKMSEGQRSERSAAPAVASREPILTPYLAERVERPLEAAGMRLLGLGQGLEPVGDLVEAFLAGGARHARIHVGVFVRLAGDRPP